MNHYKRYPWSISISVQLREKFPSEYLSRQLCCTKGCFSCFGILANGGQGDVLGRCVESSEAQTHIELVWRCVSLADVRSKIVTHKRVNVEYNVDDDEDKIV